jgi:hypothetical protein
MNSDLPAAVATQIKTPIGYKPVISTDTAALIATDNETEAHYICALLNSKFVRAFIKTYSTAGRGAAAPSVMKNVGIPKFDPKNKTHAALAALSQRLHELAAAAEPPKKEIAKLEADVDKKAAALFGIK